MSDLRPWDCQPEEPPKAYHAFCHYRDLPVSERSLDRAYSIHRRGCGTGKDPEKIPPDEVRRPAFEATKSWKQWKKRWEWASRVAAHDAEIAEQSRLEHVAEILDMNERHANLAAAMTNQVVLKLNAMQDPTNPQQLSVGQVPMWVDKATAIERRARGEATAIVKHQDGLAPDLDLSGLSDKELDQLERLLSKARPAEAGGAHG